MNWQADSKKLPSQELQRLGADPPDKSLRVTVLAAHPDDETIGASALLSRFPNTAVVFLTNGAPQDKNLWPADMRGSCEDYAGMRRSEAVNAVACAGISESQILWLGAVDQEAIFVARHLASKFADVLRELRPDFVITHPYEGGHPDHDCAALVARLAFPALRREATGCDAPQLCEMTSYHARGGQCVTGQFLNFNSSCQMVLGLSEKDRERKRRMMGEYKSQRLVLENFPISAERLRIAPVYDFARPSHEGKLWYECMKWPMTGQRWRELAVRACQQQECSCA